MSTFIYGVYRSSSDFSKALTALESMGLREFVILRDKTRSALYQSATIKNDIKSNLVAGGAIGGVIGGIAGAVASPTIHSSGIFQVLTPMMAMVSGAVVCAYFAMWVSGFLHWIDRPVLEHEVFDANITNGSMLLGVTVGAEQKLEVLELLSSAGAVELIARDTSIGGIELQSEVHELVETGRQSHTKLAA